MIESATNTPPPERTRPEQTRPEQTRIEDGVRKVLTWKKNERMGGMIPVWEKAPDTVRQQIQDHLTQAATGQSAQSFDSALAYADNNTAPPYEPDEFGFGDLVDMVNPLHHIPLVGHVYREITGDEISPIAQIIGGGVFGGAAGAAGGLINTIIEHETGKDVAGNVMAFATTGDAPQYRSAVLGTQQQESTAAQALTQASQAIDQASPHQAQTELPGTVIGFADLGGASSRPHPGRADSFQTPRYEYQSVADGRTAGTMKRAAPSPTHGPAAYDARDLPPREPITTLAMKPLSFVLRPEMMAEMTAEKTGRASGENN